MHIFDTHCHYNLDPLATNWEAHWSKAQTAGVTHSIIVGTDIESSQMALTQAKSQKQLFASVGIHPGSLEYIFHPEMKPRDIEVILEKLTLKLTTLLQSNPVALGEVGLDYYRLRSKGLKREFLENIQKTMLIIQLNLAKTYNLPVIAHVRDQIDRTEENAYFDFLKIIEKYPPTKFVLHCASGPLAYIEKAIEMGASIGVDGNVTYDSAEHIRKIVALTPSEKLLLETDAPYLAPNQHKGEICEPWMISETAQYLESELTQNLEQIYQNSFSFFDLERNQVQ